MKDRIKIIICIILGAIILFATIFYVRSTRPLNQAKAEAVTIAEKYADIDKVDKFYWFNRNKTYFTVTGTNTKGQNIIVIIPKSGEKVTVLKNPDGLTENKAKAAAKAVDTTAEIKNAALGIYQDQVVWEVTTSSSKNLNFYLIDFKTGDLVKTISNI